MTDENETPRKDISHMYRLGRTTLLVVFQGNSVVVNSYDTGSAEYLSRADLAFRLRKMADEVDGRLL